jgi:hypothetical protein
LALLAGGVYSSMDLDAPVAAAIKKVHVDNAASSTSANVAQQKLDTVTPPAAPLRVVPVVATSSPIATLQTTTPLPSSQPQVTAGTPAAVVPQPTVQQVQPIQPIRPALAVQAQPIKAETRAIGDPIKPAAPAAPAARDASGAAVQTPVVVAVPAVAKVVIADEAPVQPVATVQTSATTPAAAQSARAPQQPVKPVTAQAPGKKKKKHHVARTEEGDSSEGSDTPVKDAAPTTPKGGDQGQSEYTEIKGTATPQTLATPSSAPATTVRKQVDDSFRPTVVALAGGQAWVKISPERTVAVKSGDSVPGLGTVTSVTGNSVETDKGKFSLNTKE